MRKFLSRAAGTAALATMTMAGWWAFYGSPLAPRRDDGVMCRANRSAAAYFASTPAATLRDRLDAMKVCPEEPAPWDSDLITRSMVAAGLAVALAGLSMRLGERAREH